VLSQGDHLLHAIAVDGPAAWIERIRRLEAADPNGQQHLRTARSDDASAV